jgi:hypothetical protein
VDEGETEVRESGDRLGRDQAGAVSGGRVQDEAGETVDRFVAGDDRAVVVRDEAGTARPSGQVADPHQGPVRRLTGTDGEPPGPVGHCRSGH